MVLLTLTEERSVLTKSRQDFNQFAKEYGRYRKIDPPVLEGLMTIGSLNKQSHILEVGCGTGNYITEIATRTDAHCYGLDPAERMLAQARERPSANGINWGHGYARDLYFADNTFDLVYTVDVSHHIHHRLAYFQEALRTLKPGGKVCTVTDSEWIISHREPLATYFPETIAVNLKRYPTVAELLDCMAQAGFTNITDNLVAHPYLLYDAQGYQHKAYSSLHLIDESAFQRGLVQLEADLKHGPMLCYSYYLMIWGQKPESY